MWKHRSDVQVIHAHGLMAAIAGRLMSKVFGKPLVVSTHAVYGIGSPRMICRVARWALRGARYVLCLSEQSRAEMLGVGIPEGQAVVYRHWIDEKYFYPVDRHEARNTLEWDTKPFVALYAGRYLEVKGVEVILQMIPMLPPGVQIVFIGGGPLESKIRSVANSHPEQVRILPPIANESMRVVYSAADVLLVPSIWQEGCGRIVLEALMCGTPVIGSRRGGIPEVLTTEAGLLIDPEPAQLLDAIETLVKAPERRAGMGVAGVASAKERFSTRNAEVILSAYQ